MNKFNRRKFLYANKKFYLILSILIFLIFSFLIIYFQKNLFFKSINSFIIALSNNYEYQYTTLSINGLNNVDKSFVDEKLKKYYKSSIFLLPLDKISNEIQNNNWIKSVKLSTNYKNTLYIKIEEYEPIAIYKFNKRSFYIDKKGKIIEEIKNKLSNNNFLIFSGQSSNINAINIITILENINFLNNFKIKNINYIEKRRWDIILTNDTKLMLSEEYPEKSIKNFIDIEKNLSKNEFNNIKLFDLRNLEKTIIKYNYD